MRPAWLLTLPLLAAVVGCHRGPANDTYAIYDAVLTPAPRTMYVVRSGVTGGFDQVGRMLIALQAAMGPSGRSEALQGLLLGAAGSDVLRGDDFGRGDIHVISDHDYELLVGRRPDLLDRLLRKPTDPAGARRAWPEADGLTLLTPVGFSRDGKTAAVCFERAGGRTSEASCSILVRDDATGWTVTESFPRPSW